MIDKEKLIQIIGSKLLGVGGNTVLQDFVMTNLSQKDGKLTKDYFYKLMLGQISLDSIDEAVLLWITQSIEKFNPNIVKTEHYFTPIEISNARTFTFENKNLKENLIFYNAFEIAPKQYVCTASVYQIGMLRKHNIIKAVPEVQRDSRLVEIGNEVLRIIKINTKRVKAIEDCLINDTYAYNDIRLNLDNNGGLEQIDYNPEEKIITIYKDNLVFIPDGNHRSLACEQAISDYPELIPMFKERFFTILFTNESTSGAKKIVAQEWNREPVSNKQKNSMTRTTENLIIDMIKANDNADETYRTKIVNTGREILFNNGFILFETLTNGIKSFYNIDSIKSQTQRVELVNWLVEFFNEITNTFIDDFIHFKSLKKTKWNVQTDAWLGFVYLSSKLKDDTDWKNKLKNILSSIDWNIKNSPYNEQREQYKIEITKKFYDNIFERMSNHVIYQK